MEKYVGFYTSKPFWMGGKPDLSKFGSHYYIIPEFFNIMSEIVYEFKKEDYGVSICKDGMIMLSKNIPEEVELEEKWKNYLEILNAIYLLFESSFLKQQRTAYFEVSEITNKDAFGITFENGQMKSQSVPAFSYAEKYVMGRFLSQYDVSDKTWFYFDKRLSDRFEVDEKIKDELDVVLDVLFKSENKMSIKILSDLTKSISEYKILNYDTALVLAWFIIEKYINLLWEDFLASDNENIYAERVKAFKDNRTYTVAIKLDVLQFNEHISLEEYKKITQLRKIRNDIVHVNNKNNCDGKSCAIAFEIIKGFIKKEMLIDLEINTGYSLNGI